MSKGRSPRYAQSGVDEAAAAAVVARINATLAPGAAANLLGGDGRGFASALSLPAGYREPVLVSSCDGVGTKVALLAATGRLATAGHDLVAACANDVICHGAKPWYMLDHICCGKLDEEAVLAIVAGMERACARAGIALVGGELAQLPGTLAAGAFELSGHVVGVVEKDGLLHASRVEPGDALVALASSGPHCNGFSLVRSILAQEGAALDAKLAGGTVADALLAPSLLYGDALAALGAAGLAPHACAHITGGGLARNLARIMPPGAAARVDESSWEIPPIYAWLAARGAVGIAEIESVFNCGVGMVVAMAATEAQAALASLAGAGYEAWRLGEVVGA